MKLWEVLKALEENPKKAYKLQLKHYEQEITISSDKGFYEFIGAATSGYYFSIALQADWQEVKQPVTWQEALEAWANGKKVRCVLAGVEYEYDYKTHNTAEMWKINKGSNFAITKLEITNGTWYIEE